MAHQGQDGVDHRAADGNASDEPLGREQVLAPHHLARQRLGDARGGGEHAPLGVEVGVAHVDLHEEAIELRLGERISPLLLERVLRRQHLEGPRQGMIASGDRDAAFLHGLEEGRLGARTGAVDLVRHQELAEHRPLDEAEGAASALVLLQHLRAQNVRRHEVGRALDALHVEPEHDAERLDEARLGEARHADEEGMPSRQECDKGLIDDLLLAENDLAQALAHRQHALAQVLDFGDEGGSRLVGGRGGLDDAQFAGSLLRV